MKITSIKQATCHIVETDGEHDDNFFIRHSADNWSVRMGDSDESLWPSDEMEEEFQKALEASKTKWDDIKCTKCGCNEYEDRGGTTGTTRNDLDHVEIFFCLECREYFELKGGVL
jgi:hypothetical protein